MKYDFRTRQLYPFSDKWENGMQGEAGNTKKSALLMQI